MHKAELHYRHSIRRVTLLMPAIREHLGRTAMIEWTVRPPYQRSDAVERCDDMGAAEEGLGYHGNGESEMEETETDMWR